MTKIPEGLDAEERKLYENEERGGEARRGRCVMKVWLVGEDNPYSDDPAHDLYPFPERSAGGRLCSVILGMQRRDYLARFERRNLLHKGEKWSAPYARERAASLAHEIGPAASVVLLGRKVAAAFSIEYAPFATIYSRCFPEKKFARAVLVLPHPSGRCRLWNVPGAYERARKCVDAVEAHARGAPKESD